MASEKSVIEQFKLLCIEVDKEVLDKCVSVCEEYGIDAEDFTEQWVTFTVNHLNDAPPTLENLDLFVRKEFSKRAANRHSASAQESTRAVTGAGLTVYAAPVSAQPDNEVISNYMSTTPKRIKAETDSTSIQQTEICPVTYSPKVGHSAKYLSRANQGAVVHSYGSEELLQTLATPITSTDVISVSQVPNDDGDLFTKAVFGFELLHEKVGTFDNHISFLSQCVIKKHGLGEAVSVRQKTQNEVVVCGRVECDADARLNPRSVVLQGTWEDSLSQAVPLDLDSVQQYALFPGQVVAVRGVNPRGDRFLASQVYSDGARPAVEADDKAKGDISIVVAAGPYTTSDNMLYEPLKDLVAYIGTHKPHVVILTGPFVDSDHAKVKDNSMAETYKSFFEKLMDSLSELNTTSPHTKLYVVSSLKDAFHVNVYPTCPYSSRRKHPNVHFVPDPCTLNVGGHLIGVTATDVLMHLGQEEIALGPSGDKLGRLCSHLLAQQSYYPLWPAAVPADAALWAAHAQMPCTPHVLVLPSNFRYFVKEVNGCVVVNPEHLTKGEGGGTFARLRLRNAGPCVTAQVLRV